MKPRTRPMVRTSLKPSITLTRSSPAARKPSRDTGFPRTVRALVWARSAGYCEACGTWLGDHGGQLQHRLARRAGGSRDPVISSAANGARLCGTPQSGCHGRCEARDPHMNAAGWWLASWQDPRTEPVMVHGRDGGVTAWLTGSGEYSFQPPAVTGW